MDQSVVPFDLGRMFLGQEPVLFYAEIVVRVVIIYTYTLLLIRWIGGRSVAQLSMVEFLLVIALGSAVGDPLFYPDVPLGHTMLAITLVVFFNKGLDILILNFDRAKRVIDGMPVEIVSRGRITSHGSLARDMGLDEIKSRLRLEGVRNLGEIECAYIEPGGTFSVFRLPEPIPGLRLVPPLEIAPRPRLSGGEGLCCAGCGAVLDVPPDGDKACPYCGSQHWTWPSRPGQAETR